MIDKTPSHVSAEEWLTWPGAMVWRRAFPGRADQIRCARSFAASLFEGSKRQEDIRELVSELAANAVVHTRSGQPGGWFGLEVVADKVARVSVRDLGGAGTPKILPEPLVASELRTSGRGLFLVRAKAADLGVHGSPAHGHTVWADIDLNAEPRSETLLESW
jgi:serine/threonine-protein kinase RsbW